MKTSSPFALGSRFIPCFVAVVAFFAGACVVSAQSGGVAWRYLGPDGANVTHIAASGDTLYAAASTGTLFRSTNGISWTQVNSLSAPCKANALAVTPGRVTLVYNTCFPTDDFGGKWFITETTNSISSLRYYYQPEDISGATQIDRLLFTFNKQGIKTRFFPPLGFSGESNIFTSATITCITSRANTVFAGTADSMLITTRVLPNNFVNWRTFAIPFAPKAITMLGTARIFATSTNAIFYSSNSGANWQRISSLSENININDLAFAFGSLYAATNIGVIRSTDSGRTWLNTNQGLSTKVVSKIVANDSAVFAYIDDTTRLYRVYKNQLLPAPSDSKGIPLIHITGSSIFSLSGSVLSSSKNGFDWLPLAVLPSNLTFYDITKANDSIFYAASNDGIYTSSNGGSSWLNIGFKLESFDQVRIVAGMLYAYRALPKRLISTIVRSNNAGITWERKSLYGRYIYYFTSLTPFRGILYNSVLFDYLNGPYTYFQTQIGSLDSLGIGQISKDSIMYITTRGNEILRISQKGFIEGSKDGIAWQPYTTSGWNYYTNNGFTGSNITSFAANTQSIFVGTSGGLYVLDAPATTTTVREPAPPFAEWRITPQPANTSLTLAFMLPQVAHVRCTLHTVLGQEIATLADNSYASGAHSITAPLQNMASGLYLCRLWVDGRVVGSKSVIITR